MSRSASAATAPAPPFQAPDWANLPIFPLGAVLFPGGALPLKVFEARYVDMTRECMKSGSPFGICLIKEGAEVGAPAVPHEIGCLATITDWDMQQLGVLQIKTRGVRRFRIVSSRVEANGLIRADTAPIDDDAATGVRAEFAGCMILLKAVLPKLPAELIPEPHDFNNAAWLSNRLAEVLPIPVLAKQRLMELEDADGRLEIIHKFLGQQGLKA
jgi:Lon protease-like protein